jgi:hypothetical protein
MREPIPSWEDFSKMPEPKAAIESGDLQAALSGFATSHLLDHRRRWQFYSDVYICGFGTVLWLMGDRSGAANVWAMACDEALKGKFKYSSTGTFQAGLLLWFASVWLKDEDWHDDAAALFDKLLRKRQPVMGAGFPSLLARLLRGEIDFPEVESACKTEADMSMALFYGGVRSFEVGDAAITSKLWEQAKAPTYSQCELEHYLLLHEHKNLPK